MQITTQLRVTNVCEADHGGELVTAVRSTIDTVNLGPVRPQIESIVFLVQHGTHRIADTVTVVTTTDANE